VIPLPLHAGSPRFWAFARPSGSRAEQRIGFPVNVTLASPGRWAAASDALVQQIQSAPLVWIIGQLDDGET
jgi:hypothetical protein